MKIYAVILCSICLFFSGQFTIAQSSYKQNQYVDLALGVGKSAFSISPSWSKLHGIGKSGKFRIGYGLRYTGLWASDKNYSSAPARLTSDDSKVDTLFITSPSTHSINILINLNFAFSEKFDAGFNIDAFGIGFGAEKSGIFFSHEEAGTYASVQTASPTPWNVLLIGDNDRGQLNSEFYLRYMITEKVGIRAAVSYLFTEYTTDQTLSFDNDRFRYKNLLGVLALSVKPW